LFTPSPKVAAFEHPAKLLDPLGLNPSDFDLTFAKPQAAQQPADRRGDVIVRLMRVVPDLGRIIVEEIYKPNNGNEAATTRKLSELVAK
jgi:hypothetical protein